LRKLKLSFLCIVVLQLHHLYIFIKCSFTIKITTTITSLIHFYKGQRKL